MHLGLNGRVELPAASLLSKHLTEHTLVSLQLAGGIQALLTYSEDLIEKRTKRVHRDHS